MLRKFLMIIILSCPFVAMASVPLSHIDKVIFSSTYSAKATNGCLADPSGHIFCPCLCNEYVATCEKTYSKNTCTPDRIFTAIKTEGPAISCKKGCILHPVPTYTKCVILCKQEYNLYFNTDTCTLKPGLQKIPCTYTN